MKKVRCAVVWLVLVGLIMATALSGCGGDETQDPAPVENVDPNA